MSEISTEPKGRVTPKGDVDYSIHRTHNGAGDITHIACAYCPTFAVYKNEPGMKTSSADLGFYNRMRAKMVKHLYAEHRANIGHGPQDTGHEH